jgi:hypothetical protein
MLCVYTICVMYNAHGLLIVMSCFFSSRLTLQFSPYYALNNLTKTYYNYKHCALKMYRILFRIEVTRRIEPLNEFKILSRDLNACSLYIRTSRKT